MVATACSVGGDPLQKKSTKQDSSFDPEVLADQTIKVTVTGSTSIQVGGTATTTLKAVAMTKFSVPIPNIQIKLTPPTNGGTITNNPQTTDSNGSATFTLKSSNVAGAYSITGEGVSDTFLSKNATVTFTPGPANSISLSLTGAGSIQANGSSTTSFEASVTDQYGNAVSGEAVTLNIPTNGGSTSNPQSTNASGKASFTLTSSATEGTYAYNASIGFPATSGNQSVTFTPPPPEVTGVSSAKANATYSIGEQIDIVVTMDRATTVTGFPTLTLETGGTDAVATYISGSPGTALTFRYTVGAGEAATDLDYISTSALALAGGTMKGSGGDNAILTLPAPGAAGSLGANKNLVIDTAVPTVTNVTSTKTNGSYKQGEVIDITITFDEAVDVVGGPPQLALNSGATINNTTGTGTTTLTFQYTVGPGQNSADLDYSATTSLTSNGATLKDSGGNNAILTLPTPGAAGSLGANKALVIDTTVPTVAITSSQNITNINKTNYGVSGTCSESTRTVNVSIGSQSFTPTCTGGFWSVTGADVSGQGDSTSFAISADHTDLAGNSATQAQQTIVKDTAAPGVTLTDAIGDPTNATSWTVTATFDEAVTGLALSDFVVGNGTPSSFSAVSTTVYTILVTPTGNGSVTVNMASGAGADSAGNDSTAAAQLSVTFDGAKPNVTLSDTQSNPTNSSSWTVTATFDEDVTGVIAGDFSVTGATTSNFTAVSASQYTIDVTPTGDGTITVNMAAGAASDTASNTSNAATQLSRTYDGSKPTPTLSDVVGDPTNTSSWTVTVTFDEDVTGVAVGDFTIGNANASNFTTISASQYSIDVTPVASGAVTIDMAAGTATDSAGNTSNAAVQLSVTYDGTKPSVTLSDAQTNPTNATSWTVTATFDEDVTGVIAGDFSVSGATTSNFTAVSASQYTIDVTPTGDGVITVNMAAAAASDSAGNTSNAATALTTTFDGTKPSVTLTDVVGDPTSTTSWTVTATFDEDVTGVIAGDFSVSGATTSNFTAVSASQYTIDITPTGDGAITVDMNAAAATDSSGNTSNAAIQLSTTFDGTKPSVTLSDAEPNPTSSASWTVTATFDEDVTGVAVGDFILGNATASNFTTVSASQYTIDVTPAGDGTVTVNMNAAAATDTAGNTSNAAVQLSTTFDGSKPTPTLTDTETDPTNATSWTVTATFDEDVTGVVIGDFTVANANASNFVAVSASQYTIDVTPTGDGTVTVDMAAGIATDSSSNTSNAAVQLSITYDGTKPSVTLTDAVTDPTNATSWTVTATFDEDVTGVAVGDFILGNATASNFTTISASQYSIDVTPSGNGAVTVDMNAAAATDIAGNTSNAAGQLSTIYDSTKPSVTLTDAVSDPTNTTPFTVTATFSESVSGVAVGDFTVGNGSASNFTTISVSQYSVDITPSGNGTVTVDMAAAAATDTAGNTSNAAVQLSLTFDGTKPSVTLSDAVADPTNAGNWVVTATFDEAVTGVIIGDFIVGNGSSSSFTTVSASQYTITVTPSGQGAVTVDMNAAAATDNAGNTSNAAVQLSTTYDSVKPTPTLSDAEPNPTTSTSWTITVTFDEDVSGVAISDFTIGNGSASAFATVSASQYTFTVTPSADGPVTVDMNAGLATDTAGNTSNAAVQLSTTFDGGSAPSVTLSDTEPNPTNSGSWTVTATFDEAVTGVAIGDFIIGNGSASNFTTISSSQYSIDVTPTTDGAVTVDMNAGAADDLASNPSNAAIQLSTTYDATKPSVTLSDAVTDPTNAGNWVVTATFDEDVTGVDITDFTVGNASKATFTTVNASQYTITVTPSGEGAVTVDMAAAAATDTAGNTSNAAVQLSTTYDSTKPSVTLSDAVSDPTNTTPFTVTATFDEDVTGVAVGDFTVGNGSAGNFTTISASQYSVDITPSGNGTVTVDLVAGIASDTAGNTSNAAVQLSLTFDGTKPNVILSDAEPNPTNSGSWTVTATFDEAVTGVVVGDFVLGNASASNFTTISSSQYSIDVTPTTDGAVTVDMNAAAASDSAGNTSNAAVQLSTTYDNTKPSVTLSETESEPTNTTPFTVTATFDEAVTGVAVGDFVVGNGSAGNFTTVSTSQYTVDITPAGNGAVTIDMNAAAATDAVGNTSNAAVQLSVTFDGTKPSVTLTDAEPNPTSSASWTVTATFDEAVTGVLIGDFVVGNGSSSNFVAVNASQYTIDVTPAGDGAVTVDMAAAAATDSAGNTSNAAVQLSTTYDGSKPSVTLTHGVTNPTNSTSWTVTATFDEDVSGVAVGDFSIGNGSASNFVTISASQYTIDVTPAGDGAVTIDMAADAATDGSGNGNNAAVQLSTTYDGTKPTPTLSDAEGDPTSTTSWTITVTFDEDVTGVVIGDFTIGNGSASNFTTVSASQYTFDVTPTTDGAVTVDMNAATATDTAGNTSNAAVQLSTTYDGSKPSVTLTHAVANPTNSTPWTVTATFDEDVTGVAVGDFSIGNGSASNFTVVSASQYTVDVTPAGDGAVTIDMAAAAASDTAGNTSNAAVQLSTTYDGTKPTPTLSDGEGDPTSSSSWTITVTFDENVTGVAVGDFTIGNGSASNFTTVSASQYTFDVTPTTDGAVTVDMNAATATDTAGNTSNAAVQLSTTYDGSKPSVTLTDAVTDPTNATSWTVTATFDEDVTGVAIGDFVVGNGSSSNFVAVNASQYTIDVTPSGDGAVTVDMAADAATDTSGNGNNVAVQLSTTYDGTKPTPTLTDAEPNPTSSASWTITVTFDEDVTGVAVGDFTIGNGSASNFATVSASQYTFDVTPAGDGAVTVDMAAASATDTAGNTSNAAVQLSTTYDGSKPTPTLSDSVANPTNAASWTVTATFDENVTGVTIGDFVIGNGSSSNFVAVSASQYTIDVSPAGDGAVTVDMAADAAIDASSNGSNAAVQLSTTYDGTKPTPTLSTAESDPTATTPFTVTVTFDEDVTGVTVGDFVVGNGTAGNFTTVSASQYTVDITPTASGAVTIDMNAAAASDLAMNTSNAAGQLSITFDGTKPTPTLSTAESNPTNTSPFTVTVTFDEDVTGVAVGDFVVGNGSASNFATVSASQYTVDITPTADGTVTIDMNAAAASDSVGNTSNAAAQLSLVYDGTAPTPTLSDAEGDPTNTTSWTVTVTFNEAVSGFDATDLVIGNGADSSFSVVSSSQYTFVLTPSGQGAVTVDVNASAATDTSGNTSNAAVQLSTTFDSVKPSVTLTTSASDPTATSPFTVTATFDEDVTGVAVGDFVVGNGSASNFTTVSASQYTVDVTPAGDGAVTIDMAASAASDLATNTSNAAAQLSLTYDGTKPTPTLSTAEGDPTNTNPFTVTVTFDEDVTGVAVGDFVVGNGSAGNFATVSASQYTVDITPAGDGAVTIDMAAAAASDGVGNTSNAAVQLSITYDGTKPTPTLSTAASDPTSTNPFTVTVTFDENVTGVAVGDFVVGNGSAGNFATVSASQYTVDITPAGDGAVTIDMAAAAASDTAGNTSNAAAQLSLTYDGTKPSVTLTTGASDPTATSPFTVTATFDENVTGVAVGDFVVGNGSASNFTTVSASQYTVDVTPAGDGAVTIDMAASAASDLATNTSNAAAQLSLTYDGTKPTPTLSTAASNPTNVNPFTVTVTFDEDVTGVAVGDFVVGNGSAGNFATVSASQYTVDITPAGDGTVTIDMAAAAASDGVGNTSNAAVQLSITYDGTKPTPTLSTAASDPTSTNPFTVTVTFDENVTGVAVGDFVVGNGSAGNFATVSASQYTVDVTPAGDGAVTINMAAAAASDTAGNTSNAAAQLSLTYDGTKPSVTLTTGASDPTATSPFTVTATFDENVTGVAVGDFTVGNGTAGNFTTVSASQYTVDITPTADGAVTIDMAAAAASDTAGNTSNAAAQLSLTYDGSSPTPTLSTAASNPTNVNPFTVTVTFDEDVTGVAVGDFVVGNGSASNFATVSASQYTVDVTPAGDGAVTIDMNAAAANDGVGNNSLAAVQLSLTYDGTDPTVSITQSPAITTANENSYVISGACSENTRIVSVDVGGVTDTPTCTGGSYTTAGMNVSGLGDSGSITVTADHTDAAGNNAAQASTTIAKDTSTAAVTNITATNGDGTFGVGNTIDITITFDSSVTVTGTPQLTLNSGATVDYTSGSPGTTLTFQYTVGAGDEAADLDYSATTSLALNAGTINGTTSGNAASLTLPAPAGAGSLGANKNLAVATVPTSVVLAVTGAGSITADSSSTSTLEATVTDTNGNNVIGETVTLTIPGNGGTATTNPVVTNASGVSAFTITSSTVAGLYGYTATSTTGSVGSNTSNITFAAGAATQVSLAITGATSITADGTSTTTLQATVLDANNNPVFNESTTLNIPANGGTVVTNPQNTNASGQVTWTLTSSTTGGTYSYSATANAVTSTTVDVTFTGGATPGVTLTTAGLTTTEAGGTITFDVVLDSAPTQDVTISITSSDTSEGTVSTGTLTFTSANWSTPQTVTVTGQPDGIVDGNIAYTIVTGNTVSTDSNYSGLTVADVSLTNSDSGTAAGVSVSAISGNTNETGTTATFTMVLDTAPTQDVTIALTSSATDEATVSPASVTFTSANWSTPQTITVTGVDDALQDGDQSVTIQTGAATSSDSAYSGLDASDVTFTNTDDDSYIISVSAISGNVSESATTATFTLTMGAAPTDNVTISLTSSDTGEATLSASVATFTTGNWSTPQTITVTGVDDALQDGNQPVIITVGAASSTDGNYNGQDPPDLSLTNIDNDSTGVTVSTLSANTIENDVTNGRSSTFTVVLNSPPSASVSMSVASNNTAEATVDTATLTFTTGNWSTPQTVTVTGVDDAVQDGDQAVQIVIGACSSGDLTYNGYNPADISFTNSDDDSPGVVINPAGGLTTTEAGGQDTFEVSLGSQPTDDVTFTLTSSNTNEGTVSHSSLTFTSSNWSTKRVITVTGVDDGAQDGNQIFTINTGVVTSNDGNYSGLNPVDVTVTNNDNDTAGFNITPLTSSSSRLQTSESGTFQNFSISLKSEPTDDVTITFTSTDTGEGIVSPASMTFTADNWNSAQVLVVTGMNDGAQDGTVAYEITTGAATSNDGAYSGLNPNDLYLENIDDDTVGVTVSPDTSSTSIYVFEGGTTSSDFTVVLNSAPTETVTVDMTSSDTGEGTVTAQLTFTPDNWNAPQNATITAVNDNASDNDQPFTISFALTSADGNYDGLAVNDVNALNIDDEKAGVLLSPDNSASDRLTTSENGDSITVYVYLTSQPGSTVTITPSSTDTGEGNMVQSSLVFTTANWNSPQALTIYGVDDGTQDGSITYEIDLGNCSAQTGQYKNLDAGMVYLENLDND